MGSTSRWLDVEVGTNEIHLDSLPSNVVVADIHNDNEFKLVVGDFGKPNEGPKIKIFKGAMQMADMLLPDLPLGVVCFYASETSPKSAPLIAVAFSSCVYVYRNLKLFYKYYLPSIELNKSELDVWKQLKDPVNNNEESIILLTKKLSSIPTDVLSRQSLSFLALPMDQKLEYLDTIDEDPKKLQPEISCVTTMKLSSNDKHAVSCLVIGSESGHVDKAVILLKHGSTEGRHLFSTEEHIVAIEVMTFDNSIMVICCDKTLSSYTKKGKKQWWLSLEHRPVAMCLVPVLHLGVTLTAVALSSGHVYLYDGKIKRDTVFVRAEFNGQAAGVDLGNPSVGQKPWMIPKKSKLFLEQSMRERENATAMYETFQHDLNKLRLKVASTLIEAHTRSDNTLAVGDLESIKLAAETKSVVGLSVLFHLTTSYKVDTPYIKVPLLSPGCKLRFRTKIEEIFSENMNPDILFRSVTGQGGEGSMIKILLLKAGKCRPVLAANVQMPPTDPLLVPYDKMQPSGFKGDDVADF
ncbi:unnamed protein product [Leptidea sinapis]|uniref:Uncharacterized protein n=1 Tax=Leptidea sinapis TaxID=189913 RepID=A0A5E4QEI5_9NEOP|nr:unnamed protein product [Leptidea sinapis]